MGEKWCWWPLIALTALLTAALAATPCNESYLIQQDQCFHEATEEFQPRELLERRGPFNEFQLVQEYFTKSGLLSKIKNPNCREQLEKFTEALGNNSLWAVQMLDASAKIPIGLIVANTYQLGHYDECVQINTETVKGKYCIADVKFAPSPGKYPDYYNGHVQNEFSLHYDPLKPVWEKFKKTADPSKKRRDLYHSGVCLPNLCTAEDAQDIMQNFATQLMFSYGYQIDVSVSESSCSTLDEEPLPASAKILLYLFGFLLVSVIICTTWDVSIRDRTKTDLTPLGELVESFSMHRNMAKLSKPDTSYELNVFNGMKFYSIALILLGHRCVHSYGSPFFNPQFLEERYRKFQDMFLLNGSLIVDTFFVIGGYLTAYALFKEIEVGRKVRPIQVYIYRWLRITPMYMLVVFFYGYLLEHLGSGPIWGLKVGREARRCRENWWANFFYVNNYVQNEEMCMFQSWYISCDMHYTLLAPFIVRAIHRNPKRGLSYLGGIIALSTLIPFSYTYYYSHDGVLRVYMQIFEDLPHNTTFSEMYIKSHHRAAPYFIGMAGAYLFLYLKKIDFKFEKWMVWTGSFFSTIFSVWAIWGAWYFYIPGRPYNALENATFAAVHRLAWAVSMTWIPIAGGRRAFGIIQPILSKQALSPLSRLSFGAFLLHGAVQLYFVGSMRVPEYIFFPKLFWMTAGDIIFSFMFALILHILFEAPIGGLLKILFAPKKKASNKDQNIDADRPCQETVPIIEGEGRTKKNN